MNEQGEVVTNKARLVCEGYSQQEGIYYEETYAPVARIEVVNTVIYNMNKVQVRKDIKNIPYELWFGHSPTIKYFRMFGSVT